MFWTKKRQKFHWFLPCLHWNLSRKSKTFFYVAIHPGLIIKNTFLAKSYVFILHTSWIYGLIFSHLLHQICCCLVISLVSFFKRFQNLTVEGRLNKNDVNEETEKVVLGVWYRRCYFLPFHSIFCPSIPKIEEWKEIVILKLLFPSTFILILKIAISFHFYCYFLPFRNKRSGRK